jgi:hypothetical protein
MAMNFTQLVEAEIPALRRHARDMQASADGVKADLVTCDITPTSDSFSFREPTAQEAGSDPSKTNSLSEALLSIPEFHSIANAWKHDFYPRLRK